MTGVQTCALPILIFGIFAAFQFRSRLIQDFKLMDVGPFTKAVKKRIFANDLCKPQKMNEVMKYNPMNPVAFDSSKLNRYRFHRIQVLVNQLYILSFFCYL